MLAPLILEEVFVWKRDGITVFVLSLGVSIAASQVPSIPGDLTKDNVIERGLSKLTYTSSILYFVLIITAMISCFLTRRHVESILDDFYNAVIENYKTIKNDGGERSSKTLIGED